MNLIAYRGEKFVIELFGEGTKCPTDTFLEGLDVKVQAKAYALFARLGDTGHIRNEQKFKHLEGSDQIFEFKPTDQVRLLCFFAPGRRVIVTHGFVKKSRRTPRGEIERAEAWKREFFERSKGGGS